METEANKQKEGLRTDLPAARENGFEVVHPARKSRSCEAACLHPPQTYADASLKKPSAGAFQLTKWDGLPDKMLPVWV